jgi:hypothetical protein
VGSQTNNDILIGCYNEESCYLIDEEIEVVDLILTSFQDDFISTTYNNQTILPIQHSAIALLDCTELPNCDNECDNDTIPPSCFTQDIVLFLDQNQVEITPDMIDNGSMDDCGEVSLSINQSIFTCSDIGLNTVTLTVTDLSGKC